MPVADCNDCAWRTTTENLVDAGDEADRHRRKEMHDVEVKRAVADGGDLYGVDDPSVPDEEGESWDDAAARRRGEQLATVYLIDTEDGETVWAQGYPTGAETVDGWTVLTAWWHVSTVRRRMG